MNSKTYIAVPPWLIVAFAVCVLHSSSCSVYGNEPQAKRSGSVINQANLDKIVAGEGELSDSDLIEMLGPATLITTVGPRTLKISGVEVTFTERKMIWEDISRIQVTFDDGVIVEISGTFSPHVVSEVITYPNFKKLRGGMTQTEMYRAIGFTKARKLLDPDTGRTTLIFEQYSRFVIQLKEGKVYLPLWIKSQHR